MNKTITLLRLVFVLACLGAAVKYAYSQTITITDTNDQIVCTLRSFTYTTPDLNVQAQDCKHDVIFRGNFE